MRGASWHAMKRPNFLSPMRWGALLIFAGVTVAAHAADSEESGWTFYERFQSSINSLGAVNQLDNSVGYKFNSHFGVDAGLPVYFVWPSNSSTSTTPSSNGIGNVYAQARLSLPNPLLNFESTLTGTAPTGDKSTG